MGEEYRVDLGFAIFDFRLQGAVGLFRQGVYVVC
jgi:hypothetical protein